MIGCSPLFNASIVDSAADQRIMILLRRANLDIFWSRETSTIAANMSKIKKVLHFWKSRSNYAPLPDITPWGEEDNMGMSAAISILEHSLEKGRLADYIQFDSVRKMRSALSNIYSATSIGSKGRTTYKSATGTTFHSTDDPMQSILMERFMKGVKARMPVDSEQNLALSGKVVKRILDKIEFKWALPFTPLKEKRLLTMVAGYIVVTYTYSLRGNEGFWVDGDALCKHINLGRDDHPIPHVVVSLVGFFKAETGERMHVFSLANRTKSGIRVRVWLERVVRVLLEEGKKECPAFCDEDGYILTPQQVEEVIHPIIEQLQGSDDLGSDLPLDTEVETFYRCARSFRRGSATTAVVHKVRREAVEFVNRWRGYERNKGKAPNFNMLWHYLDGVSTRPLQLEYTSSV